jgi:DNA (cytosine-5)-methyltransferase 1
MTNHRHIVNDDISKSRLTFAPVTAIAGLCGGSMRANGGASVGTVVDLFCGCGGFSLGAELAGFRSIAAVDIDPTLQSAFKLNFPAVQAIEADIAGMDAGIWRPLIGRDRVTGLIGGPPCQGFSWMGRHRKNDPRNSLLHHFCRHVRFLRPKFFIMENVRGLLAEGKIQVLMSALDLVPGRYRILNPVMVDADRYGAATSRRRVVIIGYDPEEVDEITPKSILSPEKRSAVTVRDAIGDLPGPATGPQCEGKFGWAKYPSQRTGRLHSYARLMREAPPDCLGWREAVDLHRRGYVSGLKPTIHSKKVARRYAVVAGGKSDPVSKAYRLEWHGLCPTIRAGTGSDMGEFQSVRPLHPGKARVITVREGARLQGFPDWFVFHPTKWHSFRMIGNSISPFVSLGLLKTIAAKIA